MKNLTPEDMKRQLEAASSQSSQQQQYYYNVRCGAAREATCRRLP
jgi:hypothetical protein